MTRCVKRIHTLQIYILVIQFNILHLRLGLHQLVFQFSPSKSSLPLFLPLHKVLRETALGNINYCGNIIKFTQCCWISEKGDTVASVNVIDCTHIRGGAEKSLARPTSRCRRMESITWLERGVWSFHELQVFLLQRLKGSMSGDARDFNNIET